MTDSFNPVYYNAVDQIYHVEWASVKLARLELLKQSIARLWPHGLATRYIHVAGTSGKGSVCRYLEAVFSLGNIAGSLTGPHLFDYRERFSIQGQYASQDSVTEAWEERIRPLCIELALRGEYYVHTVNEINILIALALFERYKVEWAAIETGLGGRYDQTTALEVDAAVITNIGRDHEELLGREQWQRALDKGGVCRRDRPLFTAVQDNESLSILRAICQHMNAPLYLVTAEELEGIRQLLGRLYPHGLPDESLLNAEHQLWNAALSLMVVKHFLPEVESEEALRKFVDVRFAGRFQKIGDRIYIDIAHNPDKVEALTKELMKKFPNKSKIFVIGLSGRRSPRDVFLPIMEIADRIIVTSVSYKGVPAAIIEQELKGVNKREVPIQVVLDPEDALKDAKALQGQEDVLILTGSTYMIDQVLNPDPFLRYINATYGWRTQKSV